MNDIYYISYYAFRRLVLKAARMAAGKIPAYYPDVSAVDELMGFHESNDKKFREDVLKYFVLCLVYGFDKDYKWHALHPKKNELNADNIIAYIFTPYEGDDAVEPHVNIWKANAAPEEKENRQAAFEYIQGLLMDPELFVIKKEIKN